MLQVGWFKVTRRSPATGKRIFRMAPLHHHFEMLGWEQVTVVIRFWIITGLCVAAGLGIFYAEWVAGLLTDPTSRPRPARLRLGAASAPSSPASASPASPPPTTSPTSAPACTALDETTDEAKAEKAELLEILGADRPARRRAPPRPCPTTSTWSSPRPAGGPTAPLLAQARDRGVPVWGEVELAWRLRDPDHPAPWLAVTGTNGKTTTVQMLDAILRAAGLRSAAVGNVGLPDRRGGHGPRAVRRARGRALQLPAALHRTR